MQDEITERVVGAIGDAYGVISRVTFEQSKGKETASLDAYECVLHTYAHYRTFMVSEHARVRDCLEQAVKLDPNYAEAWAQLAQIYVEEHAFGFNPRPNSLDRAVKAAQRAVELDPTSQPAHTHLAAAYFFRHDLDAFSAEAERAVALNSNNADVLAWVGVYTAYANMSDVAKRERGIAMIRKAIALSPFHPDWYYQPIAWSHYWKGEYDQALIQSQKVNVPGDHWTWVLRATLYGALGRKAEAQPAIVNLLKLYPEFPNKIRENMRKWNTPDDIIDRVISDLRKAGLNVPPQ